MSKKAVHHEEPEEGEAWLMSYADLISLLLAVFVLLFSMSSIDPNKATVVTQAVAKYMNNKVVDSQASSDVTGVERQLQSLRLLTTFLDLGPPDEVLTRLLSIVQSPAEVQKLQALAERMGVIGNAAVVAPSLRYEISIPNSGVFEPASPYLTPTGVKFMEGLVPALKDAMSDQQKILEIAGHTDSSPIARDSAFSSNHILSAARAEAISLILVRDGLPLERIRIVGKGPSEPLYPERKANGETDPSAREKNRRVVISILSQRK